MSKQMRYLSTDDHHATAIHHWPTEVATSRGIMVWLHGMAEHGARYEALAETLNEQGWHLYCPDHRGHGLSISDACPKGHFGDDNGWDALVQDAIAVITMARETHPGLPCVLGGHSMGSFIALAAAQRTGENLAGLVLCASDYHPAAYYSLLGVLVKLARRRNGKRGGSPLIRKMTFGTWARQVPDPKTDFDWLSNDREQVQNYLEDDLCGFDCSTESWCQLVAGLRQIHSVQHLAELPDELPVLLLGGEQDPMSNMGKGMMALEQVLHAMEQPLTTHFWPEGRHEILNDHCRDQVLDALSQWLAPLALKG